MSRRGKEEDERGWSAIFRVDDDKRKVDPKRAPVLEEETLDASPNERTVIDRQISGMLNKAPEKSSKRKLPKVQINLEATMIDAAVEDPEPLEPEPEPEPEPDLDFADSTSPEGIVSAPVVVRGNEPTMIDALAYQEDSIPESLPPDAFIDSLEEETDDRSSAYARPSEDEEELLESPPIPPHMLKELGPIEQHGREEMTVLDVAAQLGLAPEKLRELGMAGAAGPATGAGAAATMPAGGHSAKGPVPKVMETAAALTPLAEQGAKVGEMLADEVEALSGHPVFKNQAALRKLHRKETMLEHLPRWLFITEGAAKIIPILLATFVIFATIGALVMVFSGLKGHDTEHVTLRFLAAQPADNAPIDRFAPTPMITLETEPPGLLVVLDRKILGATPLTFELPVRAGRVGVELTSPYFETFISEAVKNDAGEMRVRARLVRKR